MAGPLYTKTGKLSRFMIRRDRIRLPLWIVGISFFTLVVPLVFADLYPDQQDRDVMAETMQNPAMTAMVGPGDLEHYTLGAMTAHQMLLITAAVVGLMSILLVTRHTRGDEEDGRTEMIRSLPVGRLSNVHATMMVLVGTNVILALINGVGLYALNIASMDLEGSLLYGSALGASGIFFAGVTALFAQLSESSRGTTGLSVIVLVLAYLIRAIGDVGNETLSWISPLGWVTKAEVYSNNHWWPILLLAGGAAVLLVLAYYLNAVRDLGAGFFPSKPGRTRASSFLQSPVGLALKQQRTGTIVWAVGMLLIGVSYGSVFGDLNSFFESNEALKQLLASEGGQSLTDQFIPVLMVVMSLLGTVPPLMAMNKLYGEEKKNRIEHILSKAVSRTRLMFGYVIISALNGFIMLSLAAVGLWGSAASVMGDPYDFGTIYGAAIVYYPAILVMIGVSALFIGFAPGLTGLIWLYVFYSFIVLYFGGLFDFPDWIGKLSPFGYIPELPVEEMNVVPVITLAAVAVVIVIAGIIGYNKRDIQG